ncbi:hypothetical protein NBRC116188_25450 [Oceaniserpentilla sp. 4NH20-0058]
MLLTSALWVLSLTTLAQNNLLQLRVSHQQDTTRVFSGLDDLNIQRLETEVGIPLLAISSFAGTWYGGFEFTENRFVLSGSVAATRRLYRFSLPFEFEARPSKRWQHIWRYAPSYYSDESLLDQTRYVNEFAWHVKYKANRKAHWVLGIRQDTRFGIESMYPVFGLESRPNSKIYHHWIFPDMYSQVKLNKRQSVQVFAKPNGGNWRYLQADGSVASFGMTDWNIGVAVMRQLKHPLQFKLELGMKMLGEGSIAGNDGDLEDGFFFLASIETRMF